MCDDQAVRLREETQKWALWMMLTHVLATGMPAPSHLASHVCLNVKTHLPTSRDNWVRVWAESQRRGVYRSYEMVRFS